MCNVQVDVTRMLCVHLTYVPKGEQKLQTCNIHVCIPKSNFFVPIVQRLLYRAANCSKSEVLYV